MQKASMIFQLAARASAFLVVSGLAVSASQAYAQDDDNPYAVCLSNCDDMTGDTRTACRAECFGEPNPAAGDGDKTPKEGGPNPPTPTFPGGGWKPEQPH